MTTNPCCLPTLGLAIAQHTVRVAVFRVVTVLVIPSHCRLSTHTLQTRKVCCGKHITHDATQCLYYIDCITRGYILHVLCNAFTYCCEGYGRCWWAQPGAAELPDQDALALRQDKRRQLQIRRLMPRVMLQLTSAQTDSNQSAAADEAAAGADETTRQKSGGVPIPLDCL